MNDDAEIVLNLHRAWKAAFEARALDALAELYADETQFYGSTRAFYATPAGVRDYFAALPAPIVGADFAAPYVLRLGDDALVASGEVSFWIERDGQRVEAPFRITHVLARRDGRWKIAAHHASPQPAA
jgi:uncharacterized protein (TIGR02246 family)